MIIQEAKKISQCYSKKDLFYIINLLVNQKEITEAEAGFLLIDLGYTGE